ncbi:putative RING finger protein [Smittium mucronatum]|uniref:Putative RING finger protein n=1 Tax=Smittium mucronatum TaxID=133383 RepID=A0A1R0GPW3_9FUNG|nr:putative RING finger protein [Smittium mucronatum]
MSQIHYKFKAAKDYSTIVFDGLSISVHDLKQEILKVKKLNVDEFDVNIINSQTNEDDKSQIQRNTSVFVRRVPYNGPPRSNLFIPNKKDLASFPQNKSIDLSNHNVSVPNFHNTPQLSSNLPGLNDFNPMGNSLSTNTQIGDSLVEDERSKIAAMFQQSSEQWNYQQNQMEKQVFFKPFHKPTMSFRPQSFGKGHYYRPENPDRIRLKPPDKYVCFRCGQAGHWIQDCPTLNRDPSTGSIADNVKRVKRTTGIPKSFLQKVEKLEDGKHAMVTNDGTLVVATTNEDPWNEAVRLSKTSVKANSELYKNTQIPEDLKCTICSDLVTDALISPCCKSIFCSSCIEKYLLAETDPPTPNKICPICKKPDSFLVYSELLPDVKTRLNVENFLKNLKEAKVSEKLEGDAPVIGRIQTLSDDGPDSKNDGNNAYSSGITKNNPENPTQVSSLNSAGIRPPLNIPFPPNMAPPINNLIPGGPQPPLMMPNMYPFPNPMMIPHQYMNLPYNVGMNPNNGVIPMPFFNMNRPNLSINPFNFVRPNFQPQIKSLPIEELKTNTQVNNISIHGSQTPNIDPLSKNDDQFSSVDNYKAQDLMKSDENRPKSNIRSYSPPPLEGNSLFKNSKDSSYPRRNDRKRSRSRSSSYNNRSISPRRYGKDNSDFHKNHNNDRERTDTKVNNNLDDQSNNRYGFTRISKSSYSKDFSNDHPHSGFNSNERGLRFRNESPSNRYHRDTKDSNKGYKILNRNSSYSGEGYEDFKIHKDVKEHYNESRDVKVGAESGSRDLSEKHNPQNIKYLNSNSSHENSRENLNKSRNHNKDKERQNKDSRFNDEKTKGSQKDYTNVYKDRKSDVNSSKYSSKERAREFDSKNGYSEKLPSSYRNPSSDRSNSISKDKNTSKEKYFRDEPSAYKSRGNQIYEKSDNSQRQKKTAPFDPISNEISSSKLKNLEKESREISKKSSNNDVSLSKAGNKLLSSDKVDYNELNDDSSSKKTGFHRSDSVKKSYSSKDFDNSRFKEYNDSDSAKEALLGENHTDIKRSHSKEYTVLLKASDSSKNNLKTNDSEPRNKRRDSKYRNDDSSNRIESTSNSSKNSMIKSESQSFKYEEIKRIDSTESSSKNSRNDYHSDRISKRNEKQKNNYYTAESNSRSAPNDPSLGKATKDSNSKNSSKNLDYNSKSKHSSSKTSLGVSNNKLESENSKLKDMPKASENKSTSNINISTIPKKSNAKSPYKELDSSRVSDTYNSNTFNPLTNDRKSRDISEKFREKKSRSSPVKTDVDINKNNKYQKSSRVENISEKKDNKKTLGDAEKKSVSEKPSKNSISILGSAKRSGDTTDFEKKDEYESRPRKSRKLDKDPRSSRYHDLDPKPNRDSESYTKRDSAIDRDRSRKKENKEKVSSIQSRLGK